MSLLRVSQELKQYGLQAVDGEIGVIDRLYFDDLLWKVRYVVADTSGWLSNQFILISPVAIGELKTAEQLLYVELTREQIRSGPVIDIYKSVSWLCSQQNLTRCSWPLHQSVGPLCGFPVSSRQFGFTDDYYQSSQSGRRQAYLLSSSCVQGYGVSTLNGVVGYVIDFIIDTRYWVIRYLEIDACDFLPGSRLLLNPDWIEQACRTSRILTISLTCESLKAAPYFDASKGISRDYEARLFRHYKRQAYW